MYQLQHQMLLWLRFSPGGLARAVVRVYAYLLVELAAALLKGLQTLKKIVFNNLVCALLHHQHIHYLPKLMTPKDLSSEM